MQNSPHEIKSRLDRAVDVDGNVLDMAAVLDIVAVLEQFPLTKEALEKTRIGKTINLLRKKTNNEDLARRAKKLVKKWQKLVINQMGCVRNIDSPVDSNRASPVINGAIRDGKKPEASSASTDNKSTLCKGKKRGIKRKCDSSSSENSPVTFAKLSDEASSRPSTPLLSGDLEKVDSPRKATTQTDALKSSSSVNAVESGSIIVAGPDKGSLGSTASVHVHSNEGTNSEGISQETVLENSVKSDQSPPDVTVDLRTESQITDQSLDSRTESLQDEVETATAAEDAQQIVAVLTPEEQSGSCTDLSGSLNCAEGVDCSSNVDLQNDSSNDMNSAAEVKEDSSCKASVQVSTDNVQESCRNFVETSQDSTSPSVGESSSVDVTLQLNDTEQCDEEILPCAGDDESLHVSHDRQQSPREPVLDLHAQAIGINGRYSDDGQWYDWSQVMPICDGTLNILPYVILE